MVVANKTSIACWAYETVPGVAEIVAVDTVTYEFGKYNEETKGWNVPFVENSSQPYWVYSKRTPTLIDIESKFPTFSRAFLPTTAQCFAWMLKKPAQNDPSVDIVALEEGKTYPLTIRLEEKGGTNPQLTQAVGCYCVTLAAKAERGRSLTVECTFAWQKIEDFTNTTRPFLTTDPVKPGNLLTGSYNGNPYVMWDIDGDNINIPGVWKAEWVQEQEYDTVDSDAGDSQTVNTYKLKPVKILLNGIFQINDSWDDYFNRKADTNMTILLKKQDVTSFILATFTNCRIVTIRKTGHKNEGHYNSVCVIIAEKVEYTNDWYTEGGTAGTYATHWKALVS